MASLKPCSIKLALGPPFFSSMKQQHFKFKMSMAFNVLKSLFEYGNTDKQIITFHIYTPRRTNVEVTWVQTSD